MTIQGDGTIQDHGRHAQTVHVAVYETMPCLVVCMNQKFWSLAYGSVHHTCIKLSCIAREGEIEKTDPYEMEREKGMEGCRQTVRDTQPNKAKVDDTVLDEHLDDPSGATNHPHIARMKAQAIC